MSRFVPKPPLMAIFLLRVHREIGCGGSGPHKHATCPFLLLNLPVLYLLRLSPWKTSLSLSNEKRTNLLSGAIGAIDRTRSRQKNSVAETLALFERIPLSPFKKKKQNQQRRRIKTQHRSNREGRENGIVVPRCGGRKSRPGRAPPSSYPIRRGRLQNTRPPPASPAPVPQARRQGPRLQRLILHPQLCRFLSLCFIEFLVLFVG